MNLAAHHRLLRAHRYLGVAGAFPRWPALALAAVALYAWFVLRSGGEAQDALFIASFLVPFAAGTGLLSLARAGRLDLLYGTGISRLDAWTAAALRSLVLPVAVVAAAVPLLGARTANSLLLAAAALFVPAAICFAAGIVQPRYALAVIWFAVRAVFVMSSGGRAIFMRVVKPEVSGPPGLGEALIAMFALPELVMFYRLPAIAVIAALAVALSALTVSAVLMMRADFGGHRTA